MDSVEPARQPPGLVPFRWRILDAATQHCSSRIRKFARGARAVFGAAHLFEHLQQSPAFAAITFGVQNTLALEIHVIDQGITAVWRAGYPRELPFDISAVRGRGLL